jgi:hypothetical protein
MDGEVSEEDGPVESRVCLCYDLHIEVSIMEYDGIVFVHDFKYVVD